MRWRWTAKGLAAWAFDGEGGGGEALEGLVGDGWVGMGGIEEC